MRPINGLFSSLLSAFLGIGIASLICVRCAPADDSNLDNLKLLKSIEGVEDVPGGMDFDPQSNSTALELLRQSPEYKRLFYANGFMNYSNVTKNDNIFAFLLHTKEEQLSVVFTPCGTLPVTWRLLYRPPSDGQFTVLFSVAPTDEGLYEYSGVEASVFQRKGTQAGLYLIQVLSQEDSTVQMHASTAEGGQAVVNISNFKINTRIKVEKIFDTAVPTARLLLPTLNIDLEQFYLVFVISRKEFYHSLCSVTASHPDRREYVDDDVPCTQLQNDSELQVCRADGHRSLIDLQLEPNGLYYISVFAWDMLNGLSVLYSKVTFKFKKLPARLKDAVAEKANMTANGGKFSFKYKVRRNNTRPRVIPALLFYVLPCPGMGPITVEVRHEKRRVLWKQITEYEKFEIAKPLPEHRYIIILRSGVSKTARRGCDLVEVMATVRPNAFPLPAKYPSDNRVNVTVPSTCVEKKVGAANDVPLANASWFPIITKETLVYCLFMKAIRTNETVGHALNTTDALYSLLKKEHRNHRCIKLANRNELQPYIIEVKNLKPRVKYMAQIIVKKPKQWQRFLSYKILTDVHSNC